VRNREPVPQELSIIFGDAVHNLRTALDVMANDLVALNGVAPKNVYFPFARSADDLERQIKNKMRGASEDIKDLIRALKPYIGGNNALRAVHDLDITDKHIALVDVAVDIVSPSLPLLKTEHTKFEDRGGQVRFVADFSRFSTTPIDTSGFDVSDHTQILGKIDGSKAVVTIAEGLPMGGHPAVESLNQLADLVEGIVETFEAHCL
jgi:hypothetical protein